MCSLFIKRKFFFLHLRYHLLAQIHCTCNCMGNSQVSLVTRREPLTPPRAACDKVSHQGHAAEARPEAAGAGSPTTLTHRQLPEAPRSTAVTDGSGRIQDIKAAAPKAAQPRHGPHLGPGS